MTMREQARRTADLATQQTTISLLICLALAIGASMLAFGPFATTVAIIVTFAVIFGFTATLEISWRSYGRRTPEAFEEMKFPQPTGRSGQDSFTIIVPARDEPNVLRQTLEELAEQTHPNVQIIATLIEGDEPTIAEAIKARDRYPDRIEILVRRYDNRMKPYQLNAALELATGTYVGVIDAEDATHHSLLISVEAAFQTTDADVVQGPVQLMNLGNSWREWFCVHNVLEYFFWFSSRMMFQARHGFVPLGGNTVFIRRQLAVQAGGWPPSLAEDCAMGVKLSSYYGAKVVAFYDPELATREETPDNVHGLLRQRIRWDTGFGRELLNKDWWMLPKMYRKFLAWYILATPFLQAAAGALLPLTVLSTFLLDAPIALVMVTFLPYIPIALSLVMQIVGLQEFGKMFDQPVKFRHYLFLIVGFYPYQLVLIWAAICAVGRIATNNMTWWKTPHSNKHRPVVFPLDPVQEVA